MKTRPFQQNKTTIQSWASFAAREHESCGQEGGSSFFETGFSE
jgi:hypothetical protein